MIKKQDLIKEGFFYILTVCLIVFCVFPFLWMISLSFKPAEEILTSPPRWLPNKPTIEGYVNVIRGSEVYDVPFIVFIFNSLKVGSVVALFSIVIASLGGYALSRFRFIGNSLVGYILLIAQMLPGVIVLIPIYMILKYLRLIDSHLGLMLAYTTFSVPFCTWLLRGFFNTIPPELDEAARIDGCNRFSAFIKVILPLAVPGIAATAIFSFITTWNELLFAVVLLSSNDKWTLPVGLASFRGMYTIQWNHLMAASVIVTVPIVLLFFYLQRYFVAGLTKGAVKG